jgi:C-terminal processing protease CtpA/Prc
MSLVLLLALAPVIAATAADGKPHLGFSTAVAVSGMVNPTIGKLTVSNVTKGSPAEAAGLKQGDEIIEVNGKAAVGAPANELAGSIKGTKTGEHLRLKVKRGAGALTAIDIIAG